MKKNAKPAAAEFSLAAFLRRAAAYCAGAGVMLVSVSFYVRTYDSAAVKTVFTLVVFASLLTLLAVLQVTLKGNITRQKIIYALPFIVFAVWLAASFLFNPFKAATAQEFIKSLIFALTPLILFFSVDKDGVVIINRFFIITAALCFAYGLVQAADLYLLPGLDIMPWRGFFGMRVFGTHANPNFFADFIICSIFIILAAYLKNFEKKYLFLLAAGAINLYFTESKGAWLAFAAAGIFFIFLYSSFSSAVKKYSKFINAAVITAAAAAVLLTAVFSFKRMQSVDFRLVTWRGAWNMAMSAPLTGNGAGSFAALYPQFKRPEIFYIENLHNVETQHAENEYLEILSDNGIIGLSIFLWLVIYLFITARSKMKAGGDNYILLGFTSAASAVLAHNFFDISMRLVSGGFIFALLTGLVLVQCYDGPAPQNRELKNKGVWFNIFKFAVFCVVVLTLGYIIYTFNEVAGSFDENYTLGRGLLRLVAWGTALAVCGGIIYIYFKILRFTKSVWAVIFILLSLPFFLAAQQFLRADFYTSMANYFAKQQNWDAALGFYNKSFQADPLDKEVLSFRAGMALNRWQEYKSYNPSDGDADNVQRNDFDRALQDYDAVLRIAPYEPMLRHHRGELFLKAALGFYYNNDRGGALQYLKYFDMAEKEFEASLALDPVNADTYFYLSDMALAHGDYKAASNWLDAYEAGPPAVKDPRYLAVNKNNQELRARREKVAKYAK
ncbi:MAG: O-antigen ligase family protein [Elusimicrobium sp.]|jgi:O-antigen ligase/tetratricopeptide (TPR) repeat protein|nr:O-antigen ligase family protein [Elusimicrobium sp.]